MPIVDISGLSEGEFAAKYNIRTRIKKLYAEELGVSLSATTVTFITDESDKRSSSQIHVMARLYSKMFTGMEQSRLNHICDEVVKILEKEAGHVFNEAFPIPVSAMRGGSNPYTPPD